MTEIACCHASFGSGAVRVCEEINQTLTNRHPEGRFRERALSSSREQARRTLRFTMFTDN
jgi:hypothetical protein